jgi:hypothetical protein
MWWVSCSMATTRRSPTYQTAPRPSAMRTIVWQQPETSTCGSGTTIRCLAAMTCMHSWFLRPGEDTDRITMACKRRLFDCEWTPRICPWQAATEPALPCYRAISRMPLPAGYARQSAWSWPFCLPSGCAACILHLRFGFACMHNSVQRWHMSVTRVCSDVSCSACRRSCRCADAHAAVGCAGGQMRSEGTMRHGTRTRTTQPRPRQPGAMLMECVSHTHADSCQHVRRSTASQL